MSSKCPGRGRPSKRHRRHVAVDAQRRQNRHFVLVQQAIRRVRQELAQALYDGNPLDTPGAISYKVYSGEGVYLGRVESS